MILKADSWTIISKDHGIKTIDKPALLHGGTGIPRETRSFFEIEDMTPGENREITLVHKNKKYKGSFNMEKRDSANTRMFWRNNFSELLRETFAEEYKKVIQKEKIDKNNNARIIFHKVSKTKYIVRLRGRESNLEEKDEIYQEFVGKIQAHEWGEVLVKILSDLHPSYSIEKVGGKDKERHGTDLLIKIPGIIGHAEYAIAIQAKDYKDIHKTDLVSEMKQADKYWGSRGLKIIDKIVLIRQAEKEEQEELLSSSGEVRFIMVDDLKDLIFKYITSWI